MDHTEETGIPALTVRLPAAVPEAAPLALLGGGALRGLMSWTGSFGAGSEGVDSISRNFTNISEKDCNNRCYGEIGE